MNTAINIEAKRSFKAPASIRRNQNDVMTVTLKAYRIGGNSHPHFSATASSLDCGGCLHDEILKVWPEAKPIVDLHLSNADDGEPMHAEANGYYWLSGVVGGLGEQYHGGSGSSAKTQAECLNILAEYLRISTAEAQAIAGKVKETWDSVYRNQVSQPVIKYAATSEDIRTSASNAAKNTFHDFVNAQRDRWQAEATAGVELIKKLSTKELVAA